MKTFLVMLTSIFLYGCSAGTDSNMEFHHIFPQEFRKNFEQLGIDIDKYTILITKDQHKILHSQGWNKEWKAFLAKNPSKQEVIRKAEKMLSRLGFVGKLPLYDYKTKTITGEILVSEEEPLSGFIVGIGEDFGAYIIKKLEKNFLGRIVVSSLEGLGEAFVALIGIEASEGLLLTIGLIGFLAILFLFLGKWMTFASLLAVIFLFIE